MRHRGSVVCTLALLLVALAAPPAAASHDEFEPGAVILSGSGTTGRVTAVFPPDADEDEVRGRVMSTADQAGVELSRVRVVENTAPDSLRVVADAPIAQRTGFLRRRIPAEAMRPWLDLAAPDQLYVRVGSWAAVAGADASQRSSVYRVAGTTDLSYSISPWALIIPLLVLVGAAVVPFAALKVYAGVVSRRGGPAEDQLHRLRRVATAAQVVAPLAIVGVLMASRSITWPDLLLSELAPGWNPPGPLRMVVSMLGFLLPLLASVAGTVLAFLPHDRRLRGTEQTARQGLGQAARGFVLVLLPIVAWFVITTLVSDGMRGWGLVPVFILFIAVLTSLQPLILNTVAGTREVEEPLRGRVLALCAEHGLRIRDVRVLDSHGGRVANAMISGVLPTLRYVYLTDHLIEILDDDEMEAILLHEIAHGKSHHVLIKVLAGFGALAAISLALWAAGPDAFESIARTGGILPIMLAVPFVMVLLMVLVQGVVGVALEKRADDQAVQVVSSKTLARALEKLADAGKLKRRTGWLWNVLQQHPGMEQRIERLEQRAEASPGASQPA